MRRIDGRTVIAAAALAVSSVLLTGSIMYSNACATGKFGGAFHGALYGVGVSAVDQPLSIALPSAASAGEIMLVADQAGAANDDTSRTSVIYRL